MQNLGFKLNMIEINTKFYATNSNDNEYIFIVQLKKSSKSFEHRTPSKVTIVFESESFKENYEIV